LLSKSSKLLAVGKHYGVREDLSAKWPELASSLCPVVEGRVVLQAYLGSG